jgi:1-acyl-sn-glycerol-3-phosphate acyltransferase
MRGVIADWADGYLTGHGPSRGSLISIVAKRLLLVFYVPFAIGFVAAAPVLCGKKSGFRCWYWRMMRQWIRLLLNALSIRIDVDSASQEAFAKHKGDIIVANHKSHLDILALIVTIPNDRWITFAAKSELKKLPFFRRCLKAAGILLVDRGNPVAALRCLTNDYANTHRDVSLVIFPEGTRVTGNYLGEFKGGAVAMAQRLGKDIQPVCIVGTSDILPRHKLIPRSGNIRVSVLDPFFVQKNTGVKAETRRLEEYLAYHYDKLICS